MIISISAGAPNASSRTSPALGPTHRFTLRSTTSARSATPFRRRACAPRISSRVPFANRYFRPLAPLYPRAFESFDLRGFDAIVSSTTSWSKGICVPAGAVHVCYINTVSRFAFAPDEYVPRFARPFVNGLIAWDREAAQRPTRFVANSRQRSASGFERTTVAIATCCTVPSTSTASRSGTAGRRLLYRCVASLALQARRARHSRGVARERSAPHRRHGSGRTRPARACRRNDDDDARLRIGRASQRTARQRARRDRCRARKTSDSFRSKRRRPGVRRSPIEPAARSKRSSKAKPERSSTSRMPSRSRACCELRFVTLRCRAPAGARRAVLAGALHRAAASDRRTGLSREIGGVCRTDGLMRRPHRRGPIRRRPSLASSSLPLDHFWGRTTF